jgi:transposase
MGSRRTYTAEFKRDALQLLAERGGRMAEVARSLGIDRGVLREWRKQAASAGESAFPGRGRPQSSSLEEELEAVRRELLQTRQERDILKKALAYFAKQSS